MRVELKLFLAVGIAAAAGMFFAPTESAAIPYCGDDVCHSDAMFGAEDCEICPEDCGGPCTICGNGFCAGGSETCETCTADCGQCPDDGSGDGDGDGEDEGFCEEPTCEQGLHAERTALPLTCASALAGIGGPGLDGLP